MNNNMNVKYYIKYDKNIKIYFYFQKNDLKDHTIT